MKASYVDHMGTDLSVVNAARVSFGKRSDTLTERDKGLIRFLARGCTSGDWEKIVEDAMDCGGGREALFRQHPDLDAPSEGHQSHRTDLIEILQHVKNMPTHWTPFGHTAITLHIKAPIFVARQLGKHQVGMVWNEVSRRYVTEEPEFYQPDVWRKAADNVKQGSRDEAVEGNDDFRWGYHDTCLRAVEYYDELIYKGICAEQARMVLPQSMYTEWFWTGNLYSFANVYIQRTDSHAQREVQEVAHQIGEIIEPLFPVSWPALVKGD